MHSLKIRPAMMIGDPRVRRVGAGIISTSDLLPSKRDSGPNQPNRFGLSALVSPLYVGMEPVYCKLGACVLARGTPNLPIYMTPLLTHYNDPYCTCGLTAAEFSTMSGAPGPAPSEPSSYCNTFDFVLSLVFDSTAPSVRLNVTQQAVPYTPNYGYPILSGLNETLFTIRSQLGSQSGSYNSSLTPRFAAMVR
jgi:hypothetical protein